VEKEKVRSGGYQYLNNDFWKLCEDRKIYRLPQHLYIYLRGRYCKYGSTFTWADAAIRKQLGITQQTLRNAKRYLQERGLILFKSGVGKQHTQYTMLTSVLLPEKAQVVKITTLSGENHHSKCRKSSLPIYQANNQVKNKASVSPGKKKFKKYDPNSKQSLKHKSRLRELLGN